MKDWTKKLYYFFPVNLLILHFKKNQILLAFWLFFFLVVSGGIMSELGFHYLFLDPEYLHRVDFWSMLITGFSLGIFTIAFFITSYILDGHKYKFLGLMRYPFIIFSLNNSIIPLSFFCYYGYKFIDFQTNSGMQTAGSIILQILGLITGFVVVICAIFFYFSKTNRSAINDLVNSIDDVLKKNRINSRKALRKIISSRKTSFKIRSYFKFPFRIARVNHNIPINKLAITKVFDQNHLNAIFVEVIIFVVFMSLGFYKEFEPFKIPAGASTFLFFSFVMMLSGALFYWLRGWATTVVFIGFLTIDSFMQIGFISSHYEAFGLNYNTSTEVTYTKDRIKNELNNPLTVEKDKLSTLKILNKWRAKFGEEKPKMVIVTSSGGGQRSALWTTNVLQKIDKEVNGKLMPHTTLITGASGGLVGGSYYRELYYRHTQEELNMHDEVHLDNISKDILNPMIFSLFVSDLLLRYQKFEYNGKSYYKGRGYAFEETLNQNVGGIMDRSLGEYCELESSAKVPMVLIAPTIINDGGRKLFISTQHVSYLNSSFADTLYNSRNRGVDFLELFKDNDPKELRYLSALRMGATFPYITPNIHLPSNPQVEIMDAGLSDNFGVADAFQYINVFQDWIKENTSGVIILSIRDKEKNPPIEGSKSISAIDKLLNPISGAVNNRDVIQDGMNDQIFELLNKQFSGEVKLHQVLFEYKPTNEDERPASLSWHLTAVERQSIKNNINSENNQKSLAKVVQLFGSND